MKGNRKSVTRRSGNIFIHLGFEPHQAAVMLLRCELAEALRKWIDRDGLTQAEAAQRLGVAQPRISEIARNKVDRLSLDYLVGLCAKAGGGGESKDGAASASTHPLGWRSVFLPIRGLFGEALILVTVAKQAILATTEAF